MNAKNPLYRKVKHQITELLRDGRWKHGQGIPSEPRLAKRFGVSIGTIRKAVDELVAEHVLQRQQGSGTYVSSHTKDYMLNVFFQIVDRDGRKELPTPQIRTFLRARADARTADRLALTRGDPIFKIEAVLSLGGAPVIVDSIRFSAKLFPELTEQIFTQRDTTIYGLFQSRFGITVTRIEELLSAHPADSRTAALIGVGHGTPLLRIERTSYSYRDVPVDTRIRFLRTDRYSYRSELGKHAN